LVCTPPAMRRPMPTPTTFGRFMRAAVCSTFAARTSAKVAIFSSRLPDKDRYASRKMISLRRRKDNDKRSVFGDCWVFAFLFLGSDARCFADLCQYKTGYRGTQLALRLGSGFSIFREFFLWVLACCRCDQLFVHQLNLPGEHGFGFRVQRFVTGLAQGVQAAFGEAKPGVAIGQAAQDGHIAG
jgi:hypothetical protein